MRDFLPMVKAWRETYDREVNIRYLELCGKYGDQWLNHVEEARAPAEVLANKAVEGMLDGQ